MLFRSRSLQHSNDVIFEHLGIKNPSALAKDVYGYNDHGGSWPESKYEDFEGLTKFVLVLYCFLEKQDCIIGGKRFNLEYYQGIGSSEIQVGDYVADLRPEYIEVGCQEISYKTLKDVYKLAKKLKYITILTGIIATLALSSCTRYVSVYDAAHGKARCGMSLRG